MHEPLEPRRVLASLFHLPDLLPSNGGTGEAGFVVAATGDPHNLGDINGDGFDDLAVGDRVVFGAASGIPAGIDADAFFDGAGGFTVTGALLGDDLLLRGGVRGAGDFNGDGLADFAFARELGGGPSAGLRLFVVLGRGSFGAEIDVAAPGVTGVIEITGATPLGPEIDHVGDVNADGLSDVGFASAASELTIVYGRPEPTAVIDAATALAAGDATKLTGVPTEPRPEAVGDLNGDRVDDLAVVGGTTAGRVRVFYGSASGPAAGYEIAPPSSLAALGNEAGVAGAGDFDGDGVDDLIYSVTRPFDGAAIGPATVYVQFGNPDGISGGVPFNSIDDDPLTVGVSLSASALGTNLGLSIDGLGDVNGDGIDDFLAGSPGIQDDRAYLVLGPGDRSLTAGALVEELALTAAAPLPRGLALAGVSPETGLAVSRGGDLNGDGLQDYALFGDGRVWVVYGDDLTGAITHRGDAGPDSLSATPTPDRMVAGPGDDDLVGLGVGDTAAGGAGDDRFVLAEQGAERIAGGTGIDTLVVSAAITQIDLTAPESRRFRDLEVIDTRNTTDQTLTLDAQSVLSLSSSTNTVVVRRDAEDAVESGSGWNAVGDTEIDGVKLRVYRQGQATLILEQPVELPGDYNRDGAVNAADYTVWRNTLGQSDPASGGADGNRDGQVTIEDYKVWRTHFGAVSPSAIGVAPPLAALLKPAIPPTAADETAPPPPAAPTLTDAVLFDAALAAMFPMARTAPTAADATVAAPADHAAAPSIRRDLLLIEPAGGAAGARSLDANQDRDPGRSSAAPRGDRASGAAGWQALPPSVVDSVFAPGGLSLGWAPEERPAPAAGGAVDAGWPGADQAG